MDTLENTKEKEIYTPEEIQCAVDLILILQELNKSYEEEKMNKELAM